MCVYCVCEIAARGVHAAFMLSSVYFAYFACPPFSYAWGERVHAAFMLSSVYFAYFVCPPFSYAWGERVHAAFMLSSVYLLAH